ncbi:MAG TPA: hypothetical protein VG389_24800 [Myxococcota bacterium]|jgi:hypothetical protein|nr:hypothetical protein [Myxococcota bacterium]
MIPPWRAAAPALVALLALAGLGAGAGGCPGKHKPVSKMDWRPELGVYFDDQIDLVRVRMKGVKGKWNREFEERYLGRVGYSDAIAVGKVKTLYFDTRWDKTRGLIYDFELSGTLKGVLGDEKLMTLAVAEGELSGDSDSTKDEIVGQEFFLFLKWEDVDKGVFHWHLSPKTADTLEEVTALIKSAEKGSKDLGAGGERTIDATPPESGSSGSESAPKSAAPAH